MFEKYKITGNFSELDTGAEGKMWGNSSKVEPGNTGPLWRWGVNGNPVWLFLNIPNIYENKSFQRLVFGFVCFTSRIMVAFLYFINVIIAVYFISFFHMSMHCWIFLSFIYCILSFLARRIIACFCLLKNIFITTKFPQSISLALSHDFASSSLATMNKLN